MEMSHLCIIRIVVVRGEGWQMHLLRMLTPSDTRGLEAMENPVIKWIAKESEFRYVIVNREQ
jgi:hypothetical protein